MRIIAICLLVLAFIGCASPYVNQAEQLKAAYERGELSTNEYYARMHELQALDLQWRANISQGLSDMQRSMEQNRPHSGYITGPNGTYFYYGN